MVEPTRTPTHLHPQRFDLGTGRTAVAVSSGDEHTCVILDNGDLKCWGSDNLGQLGDGGSNTNTNAPSSTAIDLGTGRTAVAVSGEDHTCAILDNGEAKCWGYDNYGQLGDGGSNTNTNAPSSTAIDLGTGRTAVAVSGGEDHICAILDNGDVKCWGNDAYGQLGDGGSNTNQGSPVAVSGSNTWDSSTGLSSGSGSGSGSGSNNGTYNGNGTAWMVKDILPNSGSYLLGQMVVFGDYLYFSGVDGTHGTELWRSDGTASGTALFKDIANGTGNISSLSHSRWQHPLFRRRRHSREGGVEERWNGHRHGDGQRHLLRVWPIQLRK